jgi:hypothetical protein
MNVTLKAKCIRAKGVTFYGDLISYLFDAGISLSAVSVSSINAFSSSMVS